MKYIVTGGAGFIGSNLVDKLLIEGNEVIVLDNLAAEESKIRYKSGVYDLWENKNLKFIKQDIRNFSNYEQFEGADAMFHMAALPRVQASILNPIEYHNANVNGTLNMLNACIKAKIKRFIFTSSSAVYGDVEKTPTKETDNLNPMSPYALHKLIGEQYCELFEKLYDLETFSLRYFNVYGERQPLKGSYALVMGIFANQILNSQPITINGDGEQRRDFIYVNDVVKANITCSKIAHLKDNIFNIGSSENYSVNEIANLLSKTAKRVNNPPVTEPRETLADINKARKLLKWKPNTNLRDWVKKYKIDIGLDR